MNYKDMSDFEINKAVAKTLGMAVQEDFEANIGFTQGYHEKYPNNVWAAERDKFGVQIEPWEQFCPCNCESDSWVIIFDNKISTGWAAGDEWDARCTNQGMSGAFREFKCRHTSPLRAAMIVFLMMKDNENGNN